AVAYQCGNGIQEPGEQCDDGNTVSGDGCSSNCVFEAGGCDLNGTWDSDSDSYYYRGRFSLIEASDGSFNGVVFDRDNTTSAYSPVTGTRVGTAVTLGSFSGVEQACDYIIFNG